MLWLMVLLPLGAGVAFFMLFSSRGLLDGARQELRTTLRMQQQFVEFWMSERVRDVNLLASDPRVLSLSPRELDRMLADMLRRSPDFSGLVFVNEHGRTVVDPGSPVGLDLSDRPYFQAALEGRRYVSDVLRGRSSGADVVIVSSPVNDAQGRFRGLVFGAIRLDTVLRYLQTVHWEGSSRTFLLKAGGELLSRPDAAGSGLAQDLRGLRPGDAIFDHALARTQPQDIYRNHAGRRVVGAYTWLLDGRWLLVGEIPETAIYALHAGVLGAPLAGAVVLFLVFGPLTLRLARSLERPLQRLVEHSNKIEGGDYEVACSPEPDSSDPEEVRSLNVAYCLMVERVRDALEALRQASLTDPLTGAPNRKLLLQEGPRLIEASRRAGRPVSLLMLDLDHFKTVNDTWGHAAGDMTLKAFVEVLGRRVRQSDIFARVGGEEFAVLAPNAGPDEARELAERIRSTVERLAIPVGEGARTDLLHVTVSVGVGSLAVPDLDGKALEKLMTCADKALYQAKAEGRNAVLSCEWGGQPEGPAPDA